MLFIYKLAHNEKKKIRAERKGNQILRILPVCIKFPMYVYYYYLPDTFTYNLVQLKDGL